MPKTASKKQSPASARALTLRFWHETSFLFLTEGNTGEAEKNLNESGETFITLKPQLIGRDF